MTAATKASTRANLNGGRAVRFQEWIDNIVPGRRPALNFKHTLMPHVPWQYLPSGKRYRKAPNDAIPGLSNQSYKDTGQLNVLLQRHFLQTGFADLELQQLWKHLKDDGLWDDSLIVVAADHGVAFPHARERRRLNRKTAARDRADAALHQGPEPEEGQGRRRLGRDDRHPADDLRHPEPRPAREDGRQVRVQRRGAEPRGAAHPDPQHLRGAAHPGRRVHARAQRDHRPQPAPVRLRRRRARAPVRDRPASRADRPAGIGGGRAARRGPRVQARLRERGRRPRPTCRCTSSGA